MNRLFLICVTIQVLVLGQAGAEPLTQSSRFPLMLMVMTPEAESPTLPQGQVSLHVVTDYTSVFINKQSENWQLLADMEIGGITPGFDMRIGEHASWGYALPLVSMNAGFMDGFLADYHKAGHFPDYGRSLRPDNEFAYVVEKDGQEWFSPETGGLHPADSRLNLKYVFHKNLACSAALMYSIKLPTGDEKKGLGSGRVDHGFFLLSRMVRGPVVFYLNPGLILPHDPVTLGADVHFRTMATFFAGAEYLASENMSLNVQLNTFTSPLSGTGMETLDRPCVELAFGLVCRLRTGLSLDVSFNEDLSGPAPDFTVRAGIKADSGF
ncbi:MAG: DUF3187 family protein [Proteobacteria bacterium]|nr:DUF3187 family protein [Pseudomonadota bacterium]